MECLRQQRVYSGSQNADQCSKAFFFFNGTLFQDHLLFNWLEIAGVCEQAWVGVHYTTDRPTYRRPHSLPPHHPSGKKMEFFRRGNCAPNFRLFQELSVAAGCEDSFSICLSLIGCTATGSLPWLAKSLSLKKHELWLVVTVEERPATSMLTKFFCSQISREFCLRNK